METVQSPKLDSVGEVPAIYGGKDFATGKFWAWSVTAKEWWLVNVIVNKWVSYRSQNRAAACISFGKNTSAKSVHLISLYPTASTPTH